MTEKREITCFFCREFIALYFENQLDKTRSDQIKSHLKSCYECEELFQKVSTARQVLEELSKTEASPELISFLQREHDFWGEFFDRFGWRKWPEGMRWAVELVAIAILLGLTVNIFPWVDVVKIVKNFRTTITVTQKKPAPQEPVPSASPETVLAAKTDTPPKPAKPTPVAVAPTPALPQLPDAKEATDGNEVERPTIGYVWRGSLRVDVLEPEIVEKITAGIRSLGGERAGKVELGWERSANERYYHFLMPEKNHDELIRIFKAVGELRISKVTHPRVMKEGIQRYIVDVEGITRPTPTPAPAVENPAATPPTNPPATPIPANVPTDSETSDE